MPLCPHCHLAQAEESETCLNCGGPLLPAEAEEARLSDGDPPEADPLPAVHARRDSWKRPALLVAVALFLLAGAVLLTALRKPTASVLRPTPPPSPAPDSAPAPTAVPPNPVLAASPPVSKIDTPPSDVPLSITLVSTAGSRPPKIGQAVRLTTFTNLTPGQNAALTLTYRRNGGANTLFSFAQGSLASTTWTPLLPGRYDFLATALDDHQRAAAARHLQLIVPPNPSVSVILPPTAVPAKPTLAAALPAAPRSQPKPALPKAAAKPRKPPVVSPIRFYVAAAHFPFLRNAVVFADALHNRGYHAIPERMADSRGKAVYVVVTGSYSSLASARQQMRVLQRSGYPAYIFRSH